MKKAISGKLGLFWVTGHSSKVQSVMAERHGSTSVRQRVALLYSLEAENDEWRYSAHLLFLQFKTPSYGMVQSTVRVSLPAPVK